MSKKMKFGLLLLLSLTSVYFAEVIAGSSKFPLYDLWGIFVVIPLYGLHAIVLLFIIKKYLGNRKVLFRTLYFAGILFGLYEAYLTKVLWVGLTPAPSMLFQIAWVDFIVLVFFWHPVMSFIIPALVFEGFMTKDSYLFNGLPKRLRKIIKSKVGIVIIFVLIGLFMSGNGINPTQVIASGILNALPIVLIYYLLRKKGVHQLYTLEEILPNKKEIGICIGILAVMYIVMGLFINGEVLNLYNQIAIWVLYIVFGLAFYMKLKGNKKVEENIYEKPDLNIKMMIQSVLVIVVTCSIITAFYVYGVRDIMMVILWILWIEVGIILFVTNSVKKSTN